MSKDNNQEVFTKTSINWYPGHMAKAKRENKEKFLDYQEGKVDVPQSARTQFNIQSARPGSNNMQFVKDENGKIRIKGF